jgi:hypothetical protein
MPIHTGKVKGRRQLRFETIDAMLADAGRLAEAPETRMLGNWPLGTLLGHLAVAMNGSIDGIAFQAPWYIRLIAPLIKRRILSKGLTPGFNLPKSREPSAFPAGLSSQEGIDRLRQAAARIQVEPMNAPHPVFGKLTQQEWLQLHLRHAEMHLSFAVPK